MRKTKMKLLAQIQNLMNKDFNLSQSEIRLLKKYKIDLSEEIFILFANDSIKDEISELSKVINKTNQDVLVITFNKVNPS